MLKIYLDWNCITHCKDNLNFILRLADTYSKFIIFPYSDAHIRDLRESMLNTREFENDLNMLTNICGKHLLTYDEGKILPKYAFPQECMEKEEAYHQFIKLITDIISPKVYSNFKKSLQHLIPLEILDSYRKENDPEKAIKKIDSYIRFHVPGQNLFSLMTQFANQQHIATKDVEMKLLYLGLDWFGYKNEEKNKTIANIMADATHVFYAEHCDYLVSNDNRLRAKAKAIYSYYHASTKVISSDQLEDVIYEYISNTADINYIRYCISRYSHHKRMLDTENYVFDLFPYPVFGFFNSCFNSMYINGSTTDKYTIFKYNYTLAPYLFYDEIEAFMEFINGTISDDGKTQFWNKFAEPIIKGNEPSQKLYAIKYIDWNVTLFLSYDLLEGSPNPIMWLTIEDK